MELGRLCDELEQLLSDICFSGLRNVSPELLKKLARIGGLLENAGMRTGADLIRTFEETLAGYRRGEILLEKAVRSFCALEFYQKNIAGNLNITPPDADAAL